MSAIPAGSRSRASSWVWAPTAGLAAVSLVAMLPLSLLAGQVGNGLVALVIGAPSAAVGTLVARRLPGNPLGWLFLAIAVCMLLATDGGDYAVLVYRGGYHLPLGQAGLACDQLWFYGLALLVVVIALFPDGRMTSRGWRWVLAAYGLVLLAMLAVLITATVTALAQHPVRVDRTGGLTAIDNSSGWLGAASHALLLALAVLTLVFITYQALSWRRSSGERREQLKWLATGACVMLLALVIAVPLSSNGPVSAFREWADNAAWFGTAALPVSIGLGILRYRLYEIDRIISRTLAYAIVTGLLVGAYAGLVTLTSHVFSLTKPWEVAAATLAAAALFHPLRRRVQKIVDRRFNRARYDADQLIATFAARLQDTAHADTARVDLLTAVQDVLEPAHLSVWLPGAGR